jgi:hypothetical protein
MQGAFINPLEIIFWDSLFYSVGGPAEMSEGSGRCHLNPDNNLHLLTILEVFVLLIEATKASEIWLL